jgi:hypothetical protein
LIDYFIIAGAKLKKAGGLIGKSNLPGSNGIT